jgi:hypothetical protein
MVLPALTFVLVFAALGCQGKTEAPATPTPAMIEADLPAGTRIPAMLMKQLESGIDEEGSEVPMVVTEDIKDSAGHVVIPKGTPMQGRVTWSRREGTLDGMFNRPARLNFAIETTVAADGQAVDVCADPKDPKAAFELNRANTGTAGAAETLEAVSRDERDEKVLVAMQQLFENGDARELESEQGRERLRAIAQKLNLPGLQSVAQQNDLGKIKGLLDNLRKGSSLSRLSPAALDGPMTFTAIMEMAQVARQVNDRMNKASHGRNIKAYIGTPVTAYVARPLKVKVKA